MNESDLYLQVRQKEGRLYPDDLLARLPAAPAGHPLAAEWRARRDSASRLVGYLASLGRRLAILELGCGNGWLSHQLASIPTCYAWGLDRESPELAQAGRVFRQPNLGYMAADIFNPPFPTQTFDIIVLASVIQYFADLPGLIRALWLLVKPGGEIHLLDSPIYMDADIPAARLRTQVYYTSLGYPEMAEHYFHHAWTALEPFSPKFLYRPDSVRARLKRQLGGGASPFPWVCLRRQP